MTLYTDYTFSLLDRIELKYSVYIAALDIQFACDLPYLWTFCFDLTGEIIYGRSWEDLRRFFLRLQEEGGYNEDHKLLVYLNDLTKFFHYARTQIDIDEEILAKSPAEMIIFYSRGLEFRDFQLYSEKDIDKLIRLNNATLHHLAPDIDGLSDRVALSEEEFEYSARRVLEITNYMRKELDFVYQGDVSRIKLTKTRRIESIMTAKRRQEDDEKQRIYWRIHAMNPLSSDFGRSTLLPMLQKAFFGGINFYEKGIINKLIKNVSAADIVSAYSAEFLTSKFPISKFKILTAPKDYKKLLTDSYYTSRALLIVFEAHNVKLKPDGLAILPADNKHYYVNYKDKRERMEAIQRTTHLKLTAASTIKMCLTDIDFELFTRYYDFDKDSITINSVVGATYGYLPGYIVSTVAELYGTKRNRKEKLRELKRAGIVDKIEEELYNDDKTAIARLHGIFTQSPYVVKYGFDKETKNLKVLESKHIVKTNEFRPVVYQWGVWTVARVRQKLCRLRDELRAGGVKTISGDTDCVNFAGNADNIIADYNEKVKAKVKRRCNAMGIDPEMLADLGTLEVEKYKYYRMTAIKQYAFVRESDSGDVFEFKCGGMNTACSYFDNYSNDAKKKIDHFRCGLVIPSDAAPRKITRSCSEPKTVNYVDREGNEIRAEVKSYQFTEVMQFTLCNPLAASSKSAAATAAKGVTLTDAINSAASGIARLAVPVEPAQPNKGVKK